MSKSKFTVIRDTQEKVGNGWFFNEDEKCAGYISEHLKTGDYTIQGMEHIVLIERKKSVTEIANNFGGDWIRFKKEMERLKECKHTFVLMEFCVEELLGYPHTAKVSPAIKSKIRLTGNFLMKRIVNLQLEYNTQFIFCGNKGYEVAYSIFSNVWEKYGNK